MATGERMDLTAIVEEARGGGALVRLPSAGADLFATRARFGVNATFNGIPYRGSTTPIGDGTFCLGISKAVRAEAALEIGDPVAVTVERDTAGRTVEVPSDLQEALRAASGAAERFARISFSHRRQYADWIAEAKRPDTRRRRIEQAVSMIAEGRTRT
jgi:hypothetical protein